MAAVKKPAEPQGSADERPDVEITIFRGTLQTPDGKFGPGSTVTVSAAEAERLKGLGVVKPDDYKEPEVQSGMVKLTSSDGPQIGAYAGVVLA